MASVYLEVQNLWRFITAVANHGSEANQRLWTERGYQAARPGDCQIFTVPSPQVS
ncbi:MAG: hypothetical protein WKF79_09920 [Nocardioides sp.]